jgi:hypothetical protein
MAAVLAQEVEEREETWLLAVQLDRQQCLMDGEGREYFPYLMALGGGGAVLGVASAMEITLKEVVDFVRRTAADPEIGRAPDRLWVLDLTGPLARLAPQLGVALQGLCVVERRTTTPEMQGILRQLGGMLAAEQRQPRECHACTASVTFHSDSRCA